MLQESKELSVFRWSCLIGKREEYWKSFIKIIKKIENKLYELYQIRRHNCSKRFKSI